MREIWLRSNRRALWFGFVPPCLLLAGGAATVASNQQANARELWLIVGSLAMILGGLAIAALIALLWSPKLQRDGEFVKIRLGPRAHYHVPLHSIECFFLGEGTSGLSLPAAGSVKSAHLIVRFTERAVDWHRREVRPNLGKWEDGYLAIHGTWCEPIDEDLVRRLNHRLATVKRQANKRQAKESP